MPYIIFVLRRCLVFLLLLLVFAVRVQVFWFQGLAQRDIREARLRRPAVRILRRVQLSPEVRTGVRCGVRPLHARTRRPGRERDVRLLPVVRTRRVELHVDLEVHDGRPRPFIVVVCPSISPRIVHEAVFTSRKRVAEEQ